MVSDTPRVITNEQLGRITTALKNAGADSNCPRCHNDVFNLEDGYFVQVLQPGSGGGIRLSGDAVPSIVLTCLRCGFMMQHAVGPLGLWDQFHGGQAPQ